MTRSPSEVHLGPVARDLLHSLDEPHTLLELADWTGRHRDSVRKSLRVIERFGYVRREGGLFVRTNAGAEALADRLARGLAPGVPYKPGPKTCKRTHMARRILRALRGGAETPQEVAQRAGMAPKTAARHLRELAKRGKVDRVDWYRWAPRVGVTQ